MSDLHIVAEIGGNHMGDLKRAHKLIDEAALSGATAVKFQAFDPEDLSPNSLLHPYRLSGGPWHGRYLHDLYSETRTPWEWLPPLFKHVRENGMEPFASVFAPKNVERVIDMGSRWIKIASPEVSHRALVTKIGKTKHPVVMSDGAATMGQLLWALGELLQSNVTVLRCASIYPAATADYGFNDIRGGGMAWGVSDHTKNRQVSAAAVAMGASMVEAHLMMDPATNGRPVDVEHSLTPFEFGLLAEACTTAYSLRYRHGRVGRDRQNDTVGFRRRLAYAQDQNKGERLHSVLCVRSSHGVEPDYGPVGCILLRDVEKHQPIQREDLA